MRLHDPLARHAADRPDEPALHDPTGTLTWRELADQVAATANAVTGSVEPGGRVAVLARNCRAYVLALYGVPATGRLLVHLNWRLHPDELLDQIRRTRPALLLVEADLLAPLAARLGAMADGPDVVVVDRDGADGWEAFVTGSPAEALAVPAAEPTDLFDETPAWLIFTSGTTGPPKGALLTHAGIAAAVDTTIAARGIADDDVYLFPFPLCHVAAYNVVLHHHAGRPIVLLERFDSAEVVVATARHRVTTMSLAPTMMRTLLDHTAGDAGALDGVRQISYGAAPLTPALAAEVVERWGVGLAQGYGMTELSGNAAFLGPAEHRAGIGGDARLATAAGWAGPGVELRICDDDGAVLPAGAVGEIEVRGPQVMAGYWHDDEATAAALGPDGWLRTGDLGRLDADGLLSVVDRKKDVIITGGENVSSREVEDVLAAHPAVAEVAVIGVPDEQWGEAVCAVVVGRDDHTVELEDLAAFAKQHLAGFKQPRHVAVVDDLPRNAAGKVAKRELRERVPTMLGLAPPGRPGLLPSPR